MQNTELASLYSDSIINSHLLLDPISDVAYEPPSYA